MKSIEYKGVLVLIAILFSLGIGGCGDRKDEPEPEVDDRVLVTFSAKAFPNEAALREIPTDFGQYRLTITESRSSKFLIDTLFEDVKDGILLKPARFYIFNLEYSMPDTILQPLPYPSLYPFNPGTWHKHVRPRAMCECTVWTRSNMPNHIVFNVMYLPWSEICEERYKFHLCK